MQLADVSVVITTQDRLTDLRTCLDRLFSMCPMPAEVLVCADGCSDGTVEFLKQSSHGSLRYVVNNEGLGSVASRDNLIRGAASENILVLDDDSYPMQEDFFAKVKALFQEFPDAGVITFPEVLNDGRATISEDTEPVEVKSYPNCGALMSRSVYLSSSGFPAFFFHTHEEPDYACQCYGLGKIVVMYPQLQVRHHRSPENRNSLKADVLNARNECLSVIMRAPFLLCGPVLFGKIVVHTLHFLKRGIAHITMLPRLYWEFMLKLPAALKQRNPIATRSYVKWTRLGRLS